MGEIKLTRGFSYWKASQIFREPYFLGFQLQGVWLPLSLKTGILTLLKSHAWQLECVRSMDQVTPHKGIRSFSHCETSLMSCCSCRLKKNNQNKIISFFFLHFLFDSFVWFLWYGLGCIPPIFSKRRHLIQISPTFFLSSDLFQNLLCVNFCGMTQISEN